MAVSVSTAKTKRFVDLWAYFPGLISLGLLFTSMFGFGTPETLIDRQIDLQEEEAIEVGEIDLKPSQIGALRIDVRSAFGDRRSVDDWIVYEIQLIDSQGEIVASAIDEDWKASGIWREDGESGTWYESELTGGIDLRSPKEEKLNVVVQLLEKNTNNQPTLHVKVRNQVIDRRALAWGFAVSGVLAICTLYATSASGQKVIGTRINDSDPQGRIDLGGKDNLIRVEIKTKLDETTPRRVGINLAINNVNGERVYNQQHQVPVMVVTSNGNRSGTGKLKLFFVLEPYGSYRFKVDVQPDDPVDWTALEIRQGCKTFGDVKVTTITS